MINLYKKVKNSRRHGQHTELPDHGNDRTAPNSHELQIADHIAQPVLESQTANIKTRKLTPEEKAEKKRRNIYRWKLVLGLFGPFALQALDTTIVASALKRIAEDFGSSLPISHRYLSLTLSTQMRLSN